MCFYMQLRFPFKDVEDRFDAEIDDDTAYLQSEDINGFTYPNVPIILNENPKQIRTDYSWGLVPEWSKNTDFRKNTLIGRVESIEEKPTFAEVTHNRCLVISSGFYEWRWLDEKGKNKEKYLIINQESEIFTFAGLYSTWKNPANDEVLNSFCIMTTEANKTMEYIHNYKKRMPIILNKKDENDWLTGKLDFKDITYPKYDTLLYAMQVG
ncbi:putative SOS response-associated peptidase YedK [Flavobacterium aquaticum]|uniref:Abasic site processing protein n=2 Tax=Flavobacterium aquaticum TaxID=1236486 RepID=A0A327YKR3_9FLAO|nr:putative SOS response-associated peptidase YedK [Flavobacterium aquaticum]